VDEGHGGDVAEWSRLHGGFDVSRSLLVTAWVTGCLRAARPLARLRVPPLVVTLAALPLAGGACALSAGGRAQRGVAVVLVVVAVALDGVDGALAISSGRVTRLGFLADSLVDRAVDALLLVALWVAGADAWSAVGGGVALALLEYARARALAAGMLGIGVVTVGERPTRVVVATIALLATVVVPAHARPAATAGATATLVVGAVGLVQFLVVARRSLRDRPV
jgi:CDP-diacylglycerol--glycerol-3-phosphate 3-phosphatidyltransferase